MIGIHAEIDDAPPLSLDSSGDLFYHLTAATLTDIGDTLDDPTPHPLSLGV
jgi:hypothetical protein